MPELHSRFGGSTASRTINCPGWRQLAETLPAGDSSSVYADRGTLLHNAMEVIMNEGSEPGDLIGMEYKGQVLTEELVQEKLVPAIAAVEELFEKYGIEEFTCEERVGFTEDSWGTGDLLGGGDVWALVLDYKFGDGVMVSPVENAQFLFYGSAAYHTKETSDLFDDIDKVVFAVVQPSSHRDDDYEVWETTTARLRDYREPWLTAVEAAKADDPATCAGEWCKFCPASSICPQKTGEAHRALLMDAADLETLSANLKLIDGLKDWITQVEATAHAQMEAGAHVRGWKLVMKRSTKYWIDAEKAARVLARKLGGKKAVVEEKLISPAAAEKLAKKLDADIDISKLYEKKSSGTTLARAGDKRPAVLSGNALSAALASIN